MERATEVPVSRREQLGAGAGEGEMERPKRRKQVYLRTVYPLNPGIPHFVDVPGGW
jgi:hypothetical protein